MAYETRRAAVLKLLSDGKPHTTMEINAVDCGGSEGTKRVRELRAEGHNIDARPASSELGRDTSQWLYQLLPNSQESHFDAPAEPLVEVREPTPSLPEWANPENFFHIHLHSVFSLRDGMIPIAGLVENAKQRKQRVVAVTDHGLLSAAYELYQRANKEKILPMIGIELYTSPHRDDMLREQYRLPKVFKDADMRQSVRRSLARVHHLLALAYNGEGYRNLFRINNEAQVDGFYKSARTTNERVIEHAEGLVIGSACYAGEIPQLLWNDNWREARYLVDRFKEAFPDRFFIELMLIEWKNQIELNSRLIRLARQTNTPMIFSCDAHYLHKEDAELHPILLNIDRIRGDKDGKTKTMSDLAAEDKVWEFEAKDLYVKDLVDCWDCFWRVHRNAEFTDAVFRECLDNLTHIAAMVEPIRLEHTPRLPQIPDAIGELGRRCRSGLEARLRDGRIPPDRRQDYEDRLAFEMKVVLDIQATEYMLLFSDIAGFCEEQSIPRGPGRGSVGGSLVAWLIDITQVDPIRHGLLFERFLDLERLPKMRLGL